MVNVLRNLWISFVPVSFINLTFILHVIVNHVNKVYH